MPNLILLGLLHNSYPTGPNYLKSFWRIVSSSGTDINQSMSMVRDIVPVYTMKRLKHT